TSAAKCSATSSPTGQVMGQILTTNGGVSTNQFFLQPGPAASSIKTEERVFNGGRNTGGTCIFFRTPAGSVTSDPNVGIPYVSIDNTGTQYLVCNTHLPTTWTGNLDLKLIWWQTAGLSGNVSWSIQTWCTGQGVGRNDVTNYNAAQLPAAQATLTSGLAVY